MRENVDHKISENGHFLRGAFFENFQGSYSLENPWMAASEDLEIPRMCKALVAKSK